MQEHPLSETLWAKRETEAEEKKNRNLHMLIWNFHTALLSLEKKNYRKMVYKINAIFYVKLEEIKHPCMQVNTERISKKLLAE